MTDDQIRDLVRDLLMKIEVDSFGECLMYSENQLVEIVRRHLAKNV